MERPRVSIYKIADMFLLRQQRLPVTSMEKLGISSLLHELSVPLEKKSSVQLIASSAIVNGFQALDVDYDPSETNTDLKNV